MTIKAVGLYHIVLHGIIYTSCGSCAKHDNGLLYLQLVSNTMHVTHTHVFPCSVKIELQQAKVPHLKSSEFLINCSWRHPPQQGHKL